MTTRTTNFLRTALALLLALSGPALAIERTGRVSGYVYDPTGAPLSEVPLTISGSALQIAVSRTSGEDGKFEFDNLPVGDDYVIEVNVEGFTPIKQSGIRVRLGQGTPVDVNLTVLTETQAVATFQIVEKVNPVLNPDSAQAVTTVDAEKAAQTPIFGQVEGMAQLAAGVGNGNRPSTRGGLSRFGKFFVDGQDTSDITDGFITAPMNFNAVKSFQILTGAMDAQYNSMGVVTNAVTRDGGNKTTFDTSFILGPEFLTAKNSTPGNQPALYHRYVSNDTAAPSTSFYNLIANAGGPIIPDKLWYYASFQYNISDREYVINLPAFGTTPASQYNRPNPTRTTLGRLKLTYTPTSADRISLAFNVDRNTIQNRSGSSFITDQADNQIRRGGYWLLLNWDHNFSDSVLLQVSTGYTYKKVDELPMEEDLTKASHFFSSVTSVSSGSLSSSVIGNYLFEWKHRVQFDPTLNWKLRWNGTHQFKAGLQTSLQFSRQNTGVSGNARYSDNGGFCDPNDPTTFGFCSQRTQFTGNEPDGSLTTLARVQTVGLFLQDRWTITRKLTIIPGLRWDFGRMVGDADVGVVGSQASFGPRFSATYDVNGDRKLLFVAHAGRSTDPAQIIVAQYANAALTQYSASFDRSGNPPVNAFPDCLATPTPAACSVSGGRSSRLVAPDQKAPHMDELSVGVRTEVAEETAMGIDYTYRYYGNLWSGRETNRILDPTGTRVVGGVNGTTASIVQAVAAETAYRRYHGVDLWFQGNPGRWDLLTSYTLAFNTGTVQDYFDGYLTNPRMNQFADGFTFDDRRHTLKGAISYRLPFGIDLGMRFRYFTGVPVWQFAFNTSTTLFGNCSVTTGVAGCYYRSPRGTGVPLNNAGQFIANDPGQWVELRDPSQLILDFQARYNLGRALGLKFKIEIIALMVNLLNEVEATAYNSNIPRTSSTAFSTFGTTRQRPFPLQGELLVRFRNF